MKWQKLQFKSYKPSSPPNGPDFRFKSSVPKLLMPRRVESLPFPNITRIWSNHGNLEQGKSVGIERSRKRHANLVMAGLFSFNTQTNPLGWLPISWTVGNPIYDLSMLCNLIGLLSSSSWSKESSKPFTLYFRINGRSSMIPATLIPMLTSTADQRKTGAASTFYTPISNCYDGAQWWLTEWVCRSLKFGKCCQTYEIRNACSKLFH